MSHSFFSLRKANTYQLLFCSCFFLLNLQSKAIAQETGGGKNQNTSNLDLSLTLQGAYFKRDNIQDRSFAGFMSPSDKEGVERGFRLGESELTLGAAIDPQWSGFSNVSFSDGQANVEEAWFKSNALDNGLNLKVGRFFSGFGYMNQQHPHVWDFSDLPLMYQAIFGGDRLSLDGVQLKWLAPTDLFLELGVDAGRSLVFPSSTESGNKNGQSVYTLFAHLGDDIGQDQSYRIGISHSRFNVKDRSSSWKDNQNIPTNINFSGDSKITGFDFVWKKMAPDRSGIKFQGEFFELKEDGSVMCSDQGTTSTCTNNISSSYESKSRGFYLQSVYQFNPRWRSGLRFDSIKPIENNFGNLDNQLSHSTYRANKASFMVDYAASEFSLFRIQFARDRSLEGNPENQITIQYIMSLGKHGAHSF